MSDDYTKCGNCGLKIELINFMLGPEWRHWPTPYGNYNTSAKYRDCHMGLVATPDIPVPISSGTDRETLAKVIYDLNPDRPTLAKAMDTILRRYQVYDIRLVQDLADAVVAALNGGTR